MATSEKTSVTQAEQTREQLLKLKVDELLNSLTRRQREVIKLRYGLTDGCIYTRDDVSRIFKTSPGKVQRIEEKAVRKLQHPVRARQIEGFVDLLATDGPTDPAGYCYILQDVFGHGTPSGPNLFDYATSELSQDAFVCWLLTWAHRTHKSHNPALHQTARLFLKKMLDLHEIEPPDEFETLEIKRQFEGLDILVLINADIALLIEDKTVSSEHSDQLRRYRDAVHQAYPDRGLAPIFLKTGDQSADEELIVRENDWQNFLRRDFLQVLAYGNQQGIQNDIFRDFHARLMKIDRKYWRRRQRQGYFPSAPSTRQS